MVSSEEDDLGGIDVLWLDAIVCIRRELEVILVEYLGSVWE